MSRHVILTWCSLQKIGGSCVQKLRNMRGVLSWLHSNIVTMECSLCTSSATLSVRSHSFHSTPGAAVCYHICSGSVRFFPWVLPRTRLGLWDSLWTTSSCVVACRIMCLVFSFSWWSQQPIPYSHHPAPPRQVERWGKSSWSDFPWAQAPGPPSCAFSRLGTRWAIKLNFGLKGGILHSSASETSLEGGTAPEWGSPGRGGC